MAGVSWLSLSMPARFGAGYHEGLTVLAVSAHQYLYLRASRQYHAGRPHQGRLQRGARAVNGVLPTADNRTRRLQRAGRLRHLGRLPARTPRSPGGQARRCGSGEEVESVHQAWDEVADRARARASSSDNVAGRRGQFRLAALQLPSLGHGSPAHLGGCDTCFLSGQPTSRRLMLSASIAGTHLFHPSCSDRAHSPRTLRETSSRPA